MSIQFTPRFVRELRAITKYIHEQSQAASEKFLDNLEVFVYEKIPPQPYQYPEFSKMRTAAKVFRKAIFKKK